MPGEVSQTHAHKHGFTLLEVMAVMVIMGIIGVFVLSGRADSRANLVGRTEAVKAHLRYAQSRAMSTDDRVWGIIFSRDNSRYWLYWCGIPPSCRWNENRTPLPGSHPDAQNRIRLLDDGISIKSISQGSGPRITIAFDEWGRPYWGESDQILRNLLTAPLLITLQDTAGHTESIELTPETGFIP